MRVFPLLGATLCFVLAFAVAAPISLSLSKDLVQHPTGFSGLRRVLTTDIPLQSIHVAYSINITLGTPGLWKLNRTASSTLRSLSCSDNQCRTSCSSFGCKMCVGYLDGSETSGAWSYDTFAFLDGSNRVLSTANVPFALASEQSARFAGFGVDGLMGVAYPAANCLNSDCMLSNMQKTCMPPALDVVLAANNVPSVFGICGSDSGLGSFSLGEEDHSLYTGTVAYTQVVPLNGQKLAYAVGFSDLSVRGMSVAQSDIYSTPTIGLIDSGTTLVLLPGYMASALTTVIAASCQHCYMITNHAQPCAYLVDSDFATMPNITIDLVGVRLEVPPRVYMRPCLTGPNGYTFGFQSGGSTLGSMSFSCAFFGMVLIGDAVLNGLYTLYDRETDRVGFATATCNGNNKVYPTETPVPFPTWAWAVLGVAAVILLIALFVGIACCRRRCLLRGRASETQPIVAQVVYGAAYEQASYQSPQP